MLKFFIDYTVCMFGLMDCNNFFVSCERLFRPDLLRKPVAVLSSNDGCIVARSQEVKDLGIPMGIPYFKVKKICEEEGIVVFSSNFKLYRDISKRVMSALRSECKKCEIYSVDEAFFKLSPSVRKEEVESLRNVLIQKTGIPVSIGVADTKTLAKMANNMAKKGDGVHIIDEEGRGEALKDVPCGTVWGIGRQITSRLNEEKIYTVSDFLKRGKRVAGDICGVHGERMFLELSGVSVYKIGDEDSSSQESYTSSRSFASVTHDRSVLRSSLHYHVSSLARKLRKDQMVTSSISILMRGSRHGTYAGRRSLVRRILTVPTNDTFLLLKETDKLIGTLYDSEVPYKKTGVTMSGIQPEAYTQVSLFGKTKDEKKTESLNMIIDDINQELSNESIVFGSTLNKEWRDKKESKSNEYTTLWDEIPSVKAK